MIGLEGTRLELDHNDKQELVAAVAAAQRRAQQQQQQQQHGHQSREHSRTDEEKRLCDVRARIGLVPQPPAPRPDRAPHMP